MTTEHAILFLDCSVLVTAALLIFVPGNAFRDKGPAGHDERIQRPPASRFRFARDGDTKITGLSGESGRLVSIAPTNCKSRQDHDQHADQDSRHAIKRLRQRDRVDQVVSSQDHETNHDQVDRKVHKRRDHDVVRWHQQLEKPPMADAAVTDCEHTKDRPLR